MSKNLIFFMTDQQRMDSLGLCVGGKEVTPNWNRLKKNGVSFNRTYDSCPLCVPSRTSLATGMFPFKNGMLLNDLEGVYAKNNKPIHEILFENGYEIAHVGVNHISVEPPLKSRIDFSKWVDDDSYSSYAMQRGIDISRKDFQRDFVYENCEGNISKNPYSNKTTALWEADLDDYKDVFFAREAIEFIKRPHDKPFALFVCLWAPHPPLTVPAYYFDKFKSEDIIIPPSIGRPNLYELKSYKSGAARQLAYNGSMKTWIEAWRAHIALTNLVDEMLGRIIVAVEDCNLTNETCFVCTTDHGEQLGEHNMYQKMEMYESAVRVPCIFRFPGIESIHFDTPVSHLDFVPTLVDYLGLDCDKKTFDGISLLPYINVRIEPPLRPVYSMYAGNHKYGDQRRMVVLYPYKLIFDGFDFELFDLENDADEINNLAYEEKYQKKLIELFEVLKKWGTVNKDRFVDYDRIEL